MAEPFHAEALFAFFARHAVAGVESCRLEEHRLSYTRTLRLAHGPALVELVWAVDTPAAEPAAEPAAGTLTAHLTLSSAADREECLAGLRRLCDLDVDPLEVEAHLGHDEHLAPLVQASPGLRVPGSVDVAELCLRTLVGQQVSLAGAASCLAKLTVRYGDTVEPDFSVGPAGAAADQDEVGVTRLFPTPAALAAADPALLPMPRARGRALVGLARTLAEGRLDLSPDDDRAETRHRLLACPGIGPWTADYVLMRGLADPDVLLVTDLVIKRELVRRPTARPLAWSPWRSYATLHLWRSWTG